MIAAIVLAVILLVVLVMIVRFIWSLRLWDKD
jgi:hypothetical protein